MRSWTFGAEPVGEYGKIGTPGITSSADIARFFEVEVHQVLRTQVFRTDATGPALSNGINPAWIVAVARGDQEIDREKLARAARENFHVGLSPMQDAATQGDRWPVGYVGPDSAMKAADTVLIVDPDAAQGGLWIAGANEVDFHAKNFSWFRECGDRLADLKKTVVAEIA